MTAHDMKSAPKVGFVSLGCPKALVDSERIITKLRAEGYELSVDYQGADVVVVNTCGFLDSAKQESLDRGVSFPMPDDFCDRCRAVFISMDLASDICRDLGQGTLPDSVREIIRKHGRG